MIENSTCAIQTLELTQCTNADIYINCTHNLCYMPSDRCSMIYYDNTSENEDREIIAALQRFSQTRTAVWTVLRKNALFPGVKGPTTRHSINKFRNRSFSSAAKQKKNRISENKKLWANW